MALDLVSWDGVSICGALYNCLLSRRNLINHLSAHSRQCVPELTLAAMDASVCLLVAGLASSFTVARCSNTDAVCSNGQVLGVPMAAATDHNGFLSKVLVVLLVVLMVGIILGWKAHAWWSTGASRASNVMTETRNVATQSQVRFGWGRAEPRFVPLVDRDHGAWLDDTPVVHLATIG
jgi:hypothetical protein